MLGSLLGSAVLAGKSHGTSSAVRSSQQQGGGQQMVHLRLISQGQELYKEMDERSLADLGFKESIVY